MVPPLDELLAELQTEDCEPLFDAWLQASAKEVDKLTRIGNHDEAPTHVPRS